MPQSECDALRRATCLEVKIALGEYWQDTRKTFEMTAASTALWADMLEGWTPEQVRWALRQHMRDEPNRRPNPGHILQILKDAWGRKHADEVRAALAARQPAPSQPMTRERHEQVSAEMADLLGQFIRRVEPPREF
ncbi:hypothetical protein [Paracoccus sp. NSM]|uniref:hypothetical protein n=1 Tax=Paracoccus sp. NSM TaxID=3457784 RepID=UPI0040360998